MKSIVDRANVAVRGNVISHRNQTVAINQE
jgi:hypothetical protein